MIKEIISARATGILFTILTFIVIIAPASSFGKTVTVEAKQVRIRSGAGSYYEVIYRARRGAELEVLEERNGWYRVKLPDEKSGFVSVKSLERRTGREKGARTWIDDEGVGTVASSEIMAATKGINELGPFAKRYAEKRDIDPDVLEQFNNIPFSPEEYQSFKATLPKTTNEIYMGLSEEGILEFDTEIGTAIAIRMSQEGVSRDENLRKYVSMVGTAAVENTPLDDETFIFIVMDSPVVRSFALPGGYVFITTGALDLMKTEAELAGVLSHEIVHVVQRHGIREIERQRTRIEGEKLMDTLDEEVERLGMDRGDRDLMEELDMMADQMYELLISGRKRETEDEADKLGTLILHQTGYPADGLEKFILSTGEVEKEKKDPSYSHRPYKDRAEAIEAVIENNELKKVRNCFMERFRENTGKSDRPSYMPPHGAMEKQEPDNLK